jgi:hypothetical protein
MSIASATEQTWCKAPFVRRPRRFTDVLTRLGGGRDPTAFRALAQIARQRGDDTNADLYDVRARWEDEDSLSIRVLLAATGEGRRPLWWYAMITFAGYLLTVGVFWRRPVHWMSDGKQDLALARRVAAPSLLLSATIAGAVFVVDDVGLLQRVLIGGAAILAALMLFLASKRMADEDDGEWAHFRWIYAFAILLPTIIDIGVPLRPDEGSYYWPNKDRLLVWCFHGLQLIGWAAASLLAYAIAARMR